VNVLAGLIAGDGLVLARNYSVVMPECNAHRTSYGSLGNLFEYAIRLARVSSRRLSWLYTVFTSVEFERVELGYPRVFFVCWLSSWADPHELASLPVSPASATSSLLRKVRSAVTRDSVLNAGTNG